jgi:NAD(P)-dependent dehydrogenase (short-subunit alcohol dehydrogenase family)
MPVQNFTKTFHTKPYDGISPLRPELSQAGRTVLITGGNDGIGYSAARAFGRASAAKVIIVGRRAEANAAAATGLEKELSDKHGSATRVVGMVCDISKPSDVARLWEDLKNAGTTVDVLVLNATGISQPKTILQRGANGIWEDYNINLRAQLDLAERFYKQEAPAGRAQKVIYNPLVFPLPALSFII